MPTQALQCPLCDATSLRGTGLTAHIRARHPKEYPNWIKDPNRIQAALNAAKPNKAAMANKPAGKLQSAVTGRIVCPDCGRTFKTQAALGGHRAYLHKTAPKKAQSARPQMVAPASRDNVGKKSATSSKEESPDIAIATAASPILNTPEEHLRAAREALVARDQQIEDELKRVTDLQAEKERVRRELDAVNTALEVFGEKV
jgi:uncharacterized Zn finger protein (UPF0148 family)